MPGERAVQDGLIRSTMFDRALSSRRSDPFLITRLLAVIVHEHLAKWSMFARQSSLDAVVGRPSFLVRTGHPGRKRHFWTCDPPYFVIAPVTRRSCRDRTGRRGHRPGWWRCDRSFFAIMPVTRRNCRIRTGHHGRRLGMSMLNRRSFPGVMVTKQSCRVRTGHRGHRLDSWRCDR